MSTFTSNIPMIVNNISTMKDVSAQNIDLSGNLDVSGSSTLSTLNVSGLATFSGGISAADVNVSGHTTLQDVSCSSITTNDLNVDDVLTFDKALLFDTIVIRRVTGNDLINLRELQLWVNDQNILIGITNPSNDVSGETLGNTTEFFDNNSRLTESSIDNTRLADHIHNGLFTDANETQDIAVSLNKTNTSLYIPLTISINAYIIQSFVLYNRSLTHSPRVIGLRIELYNRVKDTTLSNPLVFTNTIETISSVYRFDFPAISTYPNELFIGSNSTSRIVNDTYALTQVVSLPINPIETTTGVSITGALDVNGSLDVSGTTTLGNVTLKAAATSSAVSHVPVFISDPASSAQTLVTRTPADFRVQIGALDQVNLGFANGTTAGPTITNSGGTNVVIPSATDGVSGIVTTGNQTFAGDKTFSNNTTINGTLGIRASARASACTQIPVFGLDPASNTRTIETRTPAQLLSDISGVSSLNAQTIDGDKTFSGNTTTNGTLSVKAATTTSVPNAIPVFASSPSGTAQQIVTRTPAQLLSDISGVSSLNAQTIDGDKTFSGNTTTNGTLSVKAATTTSVPNAIPVFASSPSGTAQQIVTRTPAQLLSDISGVSSLNAQLIAGTKTFTSSIFTTGNMGIGGFEIILGNTDQITRGNTGNSRALIKGPDSKLVMNFGNDFTGGVEIQSSLDVNGSINYNGNLVTANGTAIISLPMQGSGGYLSTNYTSGQSAGITLAWNRFSPGGGRGEIICDRQGGDGGISILNRGPSGANIGYGYIYASVFQPSSDDRIKKDETFITNAIQTIKKLRPQTYKKYSNIDCCGNYIIESGLIAQEIYYDVPELRYIVTVPYDADISGHIDSSSDPSVDPDYSNWGSTPASVNYNSVMAYLIKAIQEQQEIIEKLDARIEALENK